MNRAALLLALALALPAAGAEPDPDAGPIPFPPRPRILYTPETLKALREDPARAQARTNLVRQADRLLADGLVVPEKPGDWIFYYACPDDGSGLQAESEARHVCPVCKRVFEDERTAAAYRTRLYYRLEEQLETLARAYALTGDRAYAAPVRDALLRMARAWPTFTRHDRWGRTGLLAVVGGRRFAQHLDEATSLIHLAGAWDLVAEAACIGAEDRALIEKQLFRMPVEEIGRLELFVGSRNNHQTWFNAAKAVTGLALGDAELMRLAIRGNAGLLWQLDHSVTEDGLWYEGALAYHFYALQAITRTLEAAERVGWDLSGNARLKSLWTGPLQMAYPDGQCPVFHDSDPANLAGYRGHFEWGARYFRDPRLAEGSPAALGSTNLAGIGMAVLRRGAGAKAACLMLDYGQHGDHHGHPDKLSIVLYALGRELLLDPGRISYSVPEYQTWCRTTVAHNTVVANGANQKPDTGRLLFFADAPAAAAALAESRGAYPGIVLRRFVLLADGLLADAFLVRGSSVTTLDWLAHGRGEVSSSLALAPRDRPLGKENGYPHLTGLREGAGANGPASFTFTFEDGLFWRLWAVDAGAGDRFVTGTGIGYRTTDAVPFVLQRRAAEATLFVHLYDLSGSGAVAEIEPVPVFAEGRSAPDGAAAALRIRTATGSILLALDLDDGPPRRLSAGGKTFSRWYLEK